MPLVKTVKLKANRSPHPIEVNGVVGLLISHVQVSNGAEVLPSIPDGIQT